MIDYLNQIETNALITIACIALIVGMVLGIAVVSAVFEWMDRRSAKRGKARERGSEKSEGAKGFPVYKNAPPPPPFKGSLIVPESLPDNDFSFDTCVAKIRKGERDYD